MERRLTKRLKYRVKKKPRRWRELLLLLLLAAFLLPIPGTSPILRPLRLDSVEQKIAEWFLEQLASGQRPSGVDLPAADGGRYLPVLEPSYAALRQTTRPEQALSALWPWQLKTIDRPFDGRFVETMQAFDALSSISDHTDRLARLWDELAAASETGERPFQSFWEPEVVRWSFAGRLASQGQAPPERIRLWNPQRHRPALITTLPLVPAGGTQTGPGDEGGGGEPSNEGEDGGDEGPKPVRVPEPSSVTLLVLGAGLLALQRWRR